MIVIETVRHDEIKVKLVERNEGVFENWRYCPETGDWYFINTMSRKDVKKWLAMVI